VIKGKLSSHVKTIMEPSRLVWSGIAGAIATLLISAKGILILIASGTGAAPAIVIAGAVGGAVIAVLGVKATVVAIKIGDAGGGINVLNKLRSYKIKSYESHDV